VEWLDSIRHILNAENVVKLGYAVMTTVIFTETGLLIGFCLPGDSLLVTAGVFASPAIEQIPNLAPYKLDILWLNFYWYRQQYLAIR
jgi:membrane protein DedA with SNARE-associated domain